MMNDTLSSLTGFPPGVLLLCSQHSRDTVHVKTISDLKGKKEEEKKVKNILKSSVDIF